MLDAFDAYECSALGPSNEVSNGDEAEQHAATDDIQDQLLGTQHSRRV